RPRRAARRALPGRAEARRHGRGLRSLEEAELLGQGVANRRGEAGCRAVRLIGFGRLARRHSWCGPQGSAGRQAREAREEEVSQVTGNAAFLRGTPRKSRLLPPDFPESLFASGPPVNGGVGGRSN